MGIRRPIGNGVLSLLLLAGLLVLACEEETQNESRVEKRAEEETAPPVVREEAPAEIDTTAMGRVKLQSPKPGLKGTPPSFTWFRFPGAGSYQLRIFDPEENLLFHGPHIAENETILPKGWDEGLPTGICFWQVIAFDEEGNEIGTSAYRDFLLSKE